MRMLTERQREILSAIAAADGPLTGAALADRFGILLRTVRSEIAAINAEELLVTSSNKGYSITFSYARRAGSRPVAAREAHSPAVELDHALLKLLTKRDGELTVGDIAEALYSSTSTIERHLRQCAPLLRSFNLKVTHRQGRVCLEGGETDKRRFIGSLIAREAYGAFSSYEAIGSFFDDMDIAYVKEIVLGAVERSGFSIRRGYEQNLITNVAIALYRMRSSSYIADGDDSAPRERIEFQIARGICHDYARHTPIRPGKGDYDYLASLLIGQIEPLGALEAVIPSAAVGSEFVDAVEHIVNEVFETFLLHVDPSPSLYNFAMHVQSLIERADSGQIASTDALENVKMGCPFIYELSVLISNRISGEFGIAIEEGELGFICIHVGMLIEDIYAQERIHVLLACERYQGISERIRHEVERRFSDVATVEEYSGEGGLKGEPAADVIITTRKSLADVRGAVLVSPFFTASDYLKIENAIGLCLRRKGAERVRSLFGPFFDERLFLIRDDVRDQDAAIMLMSGRLRELGVVDGAFATSVRRREELSSTCFFDLFALPHAVEMDARCTRVCVLLSKAGVNWNGSPIHVVLMIAVCRDDRPRFMEIIDTLVEALCEPGRVNRLARSRSLEEFLELIVSG